MRGFGAKLLQTFRNEGLGSVANRTARFLAYKARRLTMNKREEIARWRTLRGRFEGQRAFLIGNGPSLNYTPLYLLADEHTMCFNRWDLMLERLSWKPTFYAVIDDRVLLDTVDVANRMSAIAEYAFFPDIHPYNVDFRGLLEPRDNVYWLFLDLARFSVNLPYCGINKTVANVGLQVLAYLGFREIYLLGVDMSYALPPSAVVTGSRDVTAVEDDDESHFDPRYFGKGRQFHVPMLDEAFARFQEARRFFSARGVRIYNATIGGKLEVFDRVSLAGVLNLTMSEQRHRFLENIRGRLRDRHIDVEALIEAAPWQNMADGSARGETAFRVDAERVSQFLRPYLQEFASFGPFDGSCLFVSRRILE